MFFALAALTRPEAAAVFGLTVAHQFVWRVLDERRLLRRLDVARIIAFSAIFVPYWLARWFYYKSFFPNSFYAKVAPGGPSAQIERGWHYLAQFVNLHLGGWILLPALIALVVAIAKARKVERGEGQERAEGGEAKRKLFGLSYLACLVIAYSAYIVYVGGDWSVGRFFVPCLPLAYLLIGAGLYEAYHFVAQQFTRWGRYVAQAGAGALLVVLAFGSSWQGEYGIFILGFDAARATEAREALGRWLGENVPPGTWIAVDAAGQVPFFSGLPAIDMFGINDLHIGRLNVATLGQGTPGHEKSDFGYIVTRAPRFVIIFGNAFDPIAEYRRAPYAWTNDEELKKFLTIYERR